MKRILALAAVVGLGFAAGCESADATQAVIDNQGTDPVYRAWWVSTYFPDGVAAGASGTVQRSIPASGTAYVVLAPGWDPASGAIPTRFVLLQSKSAFTSTRGDLLHIGVSNDSFDGNCATNQPLSQADADFIAQSIFPGELANATYDAATCSVAINEPDAGAGNDADAADAAR